MKHFLAGLIVGIVVSAGVAWATTGMWSSRAFSGYGTQGMTLRQYTAIAAMQGLVSVRNNRWSYEEVSQKAWAMADAMERME